MIDESTIISTKTGDKGTTSLYSNEVVPKASLPIRTLGKIDSLNSYLGMTAWNFKLHVVGGNSITDVLRQIQKKLQIMASVVATDPKPDLEAFTFMPTSELYINLDKITEVDVEYIELLEEEYRKYATLKPEFVLPGEESLPSAWLDMCRSKTREIEVVMNEYIDKENRIDLRTPAKFINRLSDLLFIMARREYGVKP